MMNMQAQSDMRVDFRRRTRCSAGFAAPFDGYAAYTPEAFIEQAIKPSGERAALNPHS